MTTSIVRADLGYYLLPTSFYYYLLPTTFYYVPLGRVDLPFCKLLLLVDGTVAWLKVRVRGRVRVNSSSSMGKSPG